MGEAMEQIAAVNTSAETSVQLAEQASGLIEELHRKIEGLQQDRTLSVLREMLDTLLSNAGLEDPVFVRDRNAVKATATYLLLKDEKNCAKNPRTLVDAIMNFRRRIARFLAAISSAKGVSGIVIFNPLGCKI